MVVVSRGRPMRYPVESHNINSEKIQIIGCHYPVNSSGNSNLGPGLNESTGCLELVTCWWIFLEFGQSFLVLILE